MWAKTDTEVLFNERKKETCNILNEEIQTWCYQNTHFFFQKKEEIKCSCENFKLSEI